jgi:hypothetical protein
MSLREKYPGVRPLGDIVIPTLDGNVTLILKEAGSGDREVPAWVVVRGAVHIYEDKATGMDFLGLLATVETEKKARIEKWGRMIADAKLEIAGAEKATREIREKLLRAAERAQLSGSDPLKDLAVTLEEERLRSLSRSLVRANNVLLEPCPSGDKTMALTLNLASGTTVTITEIEQATRKEGDRLFKTIGTMPAIPTSYEIQRMRGYKPIWGSCTWKGGGGR